MSTLPLTGSGGARQRANPLHRHVWRQDDNLPGKKIFQVEQLITFLQSVARIPHIPFHHRCEYLSNQGGHASSFDGEEGQDVGIPPSYLLQVGDHVQHHLKDCHHRIST